MRLMRVSISFSSGMFPRISSGVGISGAGGIGGGVCVFSLCRFSFAFLNHLSIPGCSHGTDVVDINFRRLSGGHWESTRLVTTSVVSPGCDMIAEATCSVSFSRS